MEVVDVKISELVEDPLNARTHDARNIGAIKASLRRFGQVEPLVVRAGTNVVVGGNGRLTAMRSLKWKAAAVTYQDLSDTQAAALGIALNRTAELAAWDESRLADLLATIATDGFELPEMEALALTDLIDEDRLADLGFLGGFEDPTKTKPVGGIETETVTVSFVVSPEQQAVVVKAMRVARAHGGSQGDRLAMICRDWLAAQENDDDDGTKA